MHTQFRVGEKKAMNLPKLAVSTALMTGLIGITTVNRAEAFWRWGGSPNISQFSSTISDTGEISDFSYGFKNGPTLIENASGNILLDGPNAPIYDSVKDFLIFCLILENATIFDYRSDVNPEERVSPFDVDVMVQYEISNPLDVVPDLESNLSVANLLPFLVLNEAEAPWDPNASVTETSVVTDGYLLLGDFDSQTLSSRPLDAARIEAIQTPRPEYATNPKLFTEGEPLYAFDLVNQVFLENPNPEAVPEPGVVTGVLLMGLTGGRTVLKRR
ncbi:hypothetical protein IQ260_10005 [Leptolyngbya cf. ectocarpi LEGE 11479]|uniref:Uncharacterized protein n=1 Tax=Leptolyngbya cf. ectocarpi LEGE 11479 TaxID=1828722 RepID=A0A928ZRS6_LEPEC|nr:hypothetical protein [Leptolyngbya ectocarpi]MBE9066988.1 hypothetical protein [Leptolyngbya cf. ectocarpi LEGE 11479]